MERSDWITELAAMVRPRSPAGAIHRLTAMLPELEREPAWVFSERSVQFVGARCSRTPTVDQLQKLIADFRRQHGPAEPPPFAPPSQELAQDRERREWDIRQDELRRDWDDPAGILRKVHECRGNVLMLRLLGKLVRMWAPQHLGFLPPHILEAIEIDAEIAPRDLHLRFADDTPPEGTRSVAEQLAALKADARPPTQPRYLPPEQLDQINPLPGGRKRAATPSTAPLDPVASSATADEDATSGG